MRILVQYALRCATNLSEVLLRHEKEKKKWFFCMCIIFMISSATQPNFHCIIINTQCLFSLARRGEKLLDYPITGSDGWDQLLVGV